MSITSKDFYDSQIQDAFNNATNSNEQNPETFAGAFTAANILSGLNSSINSNISSLMKPQTNISSTANTALSNGSTDKAFSDMLTDLDKSSTLSSRMSNQSDMRIKIRPKAGINSITKSSVILKPLNITNGFIFPYKPRFTVRHVARYGTQSVSHANQDFRYYIDTPSQSFEISGDLTAQDQKQAAYMLATFHFFSLVTKMRFGTNDENAGLPPPIMLLSGYGPYSFNDLPVIVETFSYNFPNDIDYVDVVVNGVKNKVPAITNISLSVTVQNTPDKLRSFNWDQFASGSLLSSGGWK